MADLIYRPQNIRDPRNHPRRIYFSCTEADLQYFDRIAQDIWKIYSDCVIAHRDFSQKLDLEDHFDQIDNVQLMVIPVTKQLLNTENFAWDTEFQRAAEKHISILPFLMDAEVQEKFNETLPMLPIYSNVYFDFYTANLHDFAVAEKVTWSEAIVESALYIAPPEE